MKSKLNPQPLLVKAVIIKEQWHRIVENKVDFKLMSLKERKLEIEDSAMVGRTRKGSRLTIAN